MATPVDSSDTEDDVPELVYSDGDSEDEPATPEDPLPLTLSDTSTYLNLLLAEEEDEQD
jgi:hypothetical protein